MTPPSPDQGKSRHEFTFEETADLLHELDDRLRGRGIAAAIFIVGGAAVAAAPGLRNRLTADIDALTHDQVVLEEARRMAAERGLPQNWLNNSAQMWMPPLSREVFDHPSEPGLRVTYADDGLLLATKLIAQRSKDVDDVVALAGSLGLSAASPEQLEAHIRSYYTDAEALEFILDGDDIDREIVLLSQEASTMLAKRQGQATPAQEQSPQPEREGPGRGDGH